jgi:hypothetical protein
MTREHDVKVGEMKWHSQSPNQKLYIVINKQFILYLSNLILIENREVS